jgi:hypothetical protein
MFPLAIIKRDKPITKDHWMDQSLHVPKGAGRIRRPPKPLLPSSLNLQPFRKFQDVETHVKSRPTQKEFPSRRREIMVRRDGGVAGGRTKLSRI